MRPRHNDTMTSDIADEPFGDPTYAFKASLIGSMCQFALKPDALEWQIGRRSGRIRYDAVRAVRLSYRPVTMQSHRFIPEIWSAGNPKIQIVSVSWRSIMEQQRLGAYGVGVVKCGGFLLATGGWRVRGRNFDQGARRVVVAIFFLVFAYQLGTYFYRTRRGRYRPDAVPVDVLPKA